MKKRFIIEGVSYIVFLIILILVLFNKTTVFDEAIYNAIISIRNPFFDFFFTLITRSMNAIPVIGILVFALLLLNKKDRWILIGNVVLTVGFNQLLKRIIVRVRPDHIRLVYENGYSFPSGHAMTSIALYGIIIYLISCYVKEKKKRILWISLLTIYILLVGISRIYVGVHYPTDIIGGYFLSIGLIISYITTFNHYYRGNNNGKNDSN